MHCSIRSGNTSASGLYFPTTHVMRACAWMTDAKVQAQVTWRKTCRCVLSRRAVQATRSACEPREDPNVKRCTHILEFMISHTIFYITSVPRKQVLECANERAGLLFPLLSLSLSMHHLYRCGCGHLCK